MAFMVRRALCTVSLILAGACCAQAQQTDAAARLRAAGVEPTLAGVRGYLESLLDPALDKQIEAWIAELGDPQFEVREVASLKLAGLGFVPTEKLDAAASGGDPERAWRAKMILKGGRADAGPLPNALRLIEEQKLAVGVPLLLKIRSRTAAPTTQEAAVRALLAIVAEADRAALDELEKSEDHAIRNTARRLLARLDGPPAVAVVKGGSIDAVKLTPGLISGGGRNLVEGWEFRPKADIVVTHLGLYDSGGDGLASAHEIAIWDIEESATPLTQETIFSGQAATLAGAFRYVGTTPIKLAAGRRYAIVALYPDTGDSTVGLVNPSGLTVEYAEHVEALGRRYSFPHDSMAFPRNLSEGAKHAIHGPTFRYSLTAETKAKDATKPAP